MCVCACACAHVHARMKDQMKDQETLWKEIQETDN